MTSMTAMAATTQLNVDSKCFGNANAITPTQNYPLLHTIFLSIDNKMKNKRGDKANLLVYEVLRLSVHKYLCNRC